MAESPRGSFTSGETATTVLEGMTFANCRVVESPVDVGMKRFSDLIHLDGKNGAGVLVSDASPTLRHLRVIKATAADGAGLYVENSMSKIDHLNVTDATAWGGHTTTSAPPMSALASRAAVAASRVVCALRPLPACVLL